MFSEGKIKYLLILFFFLAVIIAMFFIYSNIGKPERVEQYLTKPSWATQLNCLVRGGKLEKIPREIKDQVIEENGLQENELVSYYYTCHFK